jgi:hypothetical protein
MGNTPNTPETKTDQPGEKTGTFLEQSPKAGHCGGSCSGKGGCGGGKTPEKAPEQGNDDRPFSRALAHVVKTSPGLSAWGTFFAGVAVTGPALGTGGLLLSGAAGYAVYAWGKKLQEEEAAKKKAASKNKPSGPCGGGC